MTKNEAIRIIAEYMEYLYDEEVNRYYLKGDGEAYKLTDLKYSDSLDALIPVWERLNRCSKELFPRMINKKKGDISYYKVSFFMYGKYSFIEHESDDLKEAACLATAKAIKELDSEV